MKFSLVHRSYYHYTAPVSDSVMEMRIHPFDGDGQKIIDRRCDINPAVPLYSFTDTFGNRVEHFSIPFSHRQLEIVNSATVETTAKSVGESLIDIPLADYLQIISNRDPHYYFFRNYSYYARRINRDRCGIFPNFKQSNTLAEIVPDLNQAIFELFTYDPKATEIDTPLERIIEMRRGVCQDYAHVMLSLLRNLRIPCRYVSGYVEGTDSDDEADRLIGSLASHAWVEVLLPGDAWWGWDPTNNQTVGEQHIKVATGRDYLDVSPMRGTFRGGGSQKLTVEVTLKRI